MKNKFDDVDFEFRKCLVFVIWNSINLVLIMWIVVYKYGDDGFIEFVISYILYEIVNVLYYEEINSLRKKKNCLKV